MIKLDKDYSDYTDETDDAYPAGKAVNASTEESIDGTPYLEKWMNNIHGAFTALWVKAFGSVEGMSGKPDSVDHSDVLLAVEKLIERPLSLHSDTLGANAHGATCETTPGQIVTRDQVGRAKVAAPVAADDIARKEEVDAEAQVRISADSAEANARISADATEATARASAVTTEANTRASADSGLSGRITAEATARLNADNTLQHNINLANNARTSADTAEAQTRLNGDNALSGRINSNDTELHSLKNYSTGETNTGKKWIDGRDIYRMCYQGISSYSHMVLFNIGSNRTVISPHICILYEGHEWMSNPSDGTCRVTPAGNCYVVCYDNFIARPYTIIVEYVK